MYMRSYYIVICRVRFTTDSRERTRIKAQNRFLRMVKDHKDKHTAPEDIVYIKRRFAALLGSCTDIADHTNSHIFAKVGFEEKKYTFVFRTHTSESQRVHVL